jgi:23S rRNA (uracil1939-C5)-methyltransferase
LNLTIEKLVYGGDGLARLPADEHGRGKAVFLPFVLEGEEVEAELTEQKPGFARARAQSIVRPSPKRVDTPCPYFQSCGGCHYQHTSYEHQLEIKAAILKENLRRIAKLELETELEIVPSPPWNYRNRTRVKIQSGPEFALGYYRFNSHELLPVRECPISSPLINQAIAALWEWGGAEQVSPEVREIEIFADSGDEALLLEVYCARGVSDAQGLAETIRSKIPHATGVVVFENGSVPSSSGDRGPRNLAAAGPGEILYKTGEATYRVSAGAFFQVNRHRVDRLANLVITGLTGNLALDLYAGVGLFSSLLAGSFAQVIAVESSQTSHADLAHNSPENVKAVCAGTEPYLQKAAGKLRPDVVVVDPPRSGLGERVVKLLSGLKAAKLIYVSCDPSTLARDLRGLLDAGYRVEQAHLVDLFPQTFHLESVFRLARQ